MLTEIGRQLESRISLKKIEERFSRQLIKPRIWSCLQRSILSLASERVKEKSLLILDISDLKKKYAEKMEYLARVRNGSEVVRLLKDTGPTRSLLVKLTVMK
jgi:rRNA-processing protein FCF1